MGESAIKFDKPKNKFYNTLYCKLEQEKINMARGLLSYAIRDADANVNSLAVNFDTTGLTLVQMQEFADIVTNALDDVTEGVIDSINLTLGLTLPGGIDTDPVAGSNNQEGGLILFADGGGFKEGIRVPALIQAAFSGKTITLTNTAIQAFTNLFTTDVAITGGDARLTNRYLLDYVSVVSGVKSFRRK